MNIKTDSVGVQRGRREAAAAVFCTVSLTLHYCSLINNSFLFIDFSLLFGRVQWEGPETVRLHTALGAVWVVGGGELWYVEAQHHLKMLSAVAVFDSTG